MPDDRYEILLAAKDEISGTLNKVQKELKETGTATKKTAGNIEQMDKRVSGLKVNLVALQAGVALARTAFGAFQRVARAVGQVIGESVDASAEQEKIFRNLSLAVEGVGESYATQEKKLTSLFAELQKFTEYGDTDSAKALAEMIRLTGDYEKSVVALELAMDLAQARNLSLDTATKIVGQSLAGNTDIAGRYITELRSNSKEMEGLTTNTEKGAKALEIFQKTVGGTAREMGDTFESLRKSVDNYRGDALEAFGDVISKNPAVLQVMEAQKEAWQKVEQAIIANKGAIGDVVSTYEQLKLQVVESLGGLVDEIVVESQRALDSLQIIFDPVGYLTRLGKNALSFAVDEPLKALVDATNELKTAEEQRVAIAQAILEKMQAQTAELMKQKPGMGFGVFDDEGKFTSPGSFTEQQKRFAGEGLGFAGGVVDTGDPFSGDTLRDLYALRDFMEQQELARQEHLAALGGTGSAQDLALQRRAQEAGFATVEEAMASGALTQRQEMDFRASQQKSEMDLTGQDQGSARDLTFAQYFGQFLGEWLDFRQSGGLEGTAEQLAEFQQHLFEVNAQMKEAAQTGLNNFWEGPAAFGDVWEAHIGVLKLLNETAIERAELEGKVVVKTDLLGNAIANLDDRFGFFTANWNEAVEVMEPLVFIADQFGLTLETLNALGLNLGGTLETLTSDLQLVGDALAENIFVSMGTGTERGGSVGPMTASDVLDAMEASAEPFFGGIPPGTGPGGTGPFGDTGAPFGDEFAGQRDIRIGGDLGMELLGEALNRQEEVEEEQLSIQQQILNTDNDIKRFTEQTWEEQELTRQELKGELRGVRQEIANLGNIDASKWSISQVARALAQLLGLDAAA